MASGGANFAIAFIPMLFLLIQLAIVVFVILTVLRMRDALESIAKEVKYIRIAMEKEKKGD